MSNNESKKVRVSKLQVGDVVKYQGLETRIMMIESYGCGWKKLTMGGLGSVTVTERRFKGSQFLTKLSF